MQGNKRLRYREGGPESEPMRMTSNLGNRYRLNDPQPIEEREAEVVGPRAKHRTMGKAPQRSKDKAKGDKLKLKIEGGEDRVEKSTEKVNVKQEEAKIQIKTGGDQLKPKPEDELKLTAETRTKIKTAEGEPIWNDIKLLRRSQADTTKSSIETSGGFRDFLHLMQKVQ